MYFTYFFIKQISNGFTYLFDIYLFAKRVRKSITAYSTHPKQNSVELFKVIIYVAGIIRYFLNHGF